MTFFSQTKCRPSRKGYRCDMCHQPIKAGTRYDRTACVYDGVWSTFRVHTHCTDFARSSPYMRSEDFEGYLIGFDALREAITLTSIDGVPKDLRHLHPLGHIDT